MVYPASQADGWCDGAKHVVHQVVRDRYAALWVFKVGDLGLDGGGAAVLTAFATRMTYS